MNGRHSASRIEEVRMLYCDTSISVAEIKKRTGVSSSTINAWMHLHGWAPRGIPLALDPAARGSNTPEAGGGASPPLPAANTPRRKRAAGRPKMTSLVDRLYRVIVHSLEQMETRMSDDGNSAGDNPEREARAIGNIVRSIEKLKELEPDNAKPSTSTGGKSRYPLSPGEEDRLRDEIVERLLKLRERHRNTTGGG